MNSSTYQITESAPTEDLTTLATIKDELGIVDANSDDKLSRWIREESGRIADYCGRTFGQVSVVETFRFDHDNYMLWRRSESIYELAVRFTPIQSISSIVVDDVTYTTDHYETNDESGIIYRINDFGHRAEWVGSKIVITYVGGYALLDSLPYGLEHACITLVRNRWLMTKDNRDPLQRSLIIPGVVEKQWWQPQVGQTVGISGLPEEVEGMLQPYIEHHV